MALFCLEMRTQVGSIGAPRPQDKQKLVFNHRADVITSNQCCEISADGGDVPNETKAAKKKRKTMDHSDGGLGGVIYSVAMISRFSGS